MSAGRTIFRNIRALALAKIVTLVTGLVSTAWTARILGPENYGILGFGTSFLAYAALLVNMGLSTYAVREIARDRSNARPLVEHVLTLRVLMAVLVAAGYGLLVTSLDKPWLVKAVLVVQASQLIGNALVIDFFYQGNERMGVIATREAGTSFATMAAVLALVRTADDVVVAAAITGGSIVLNALLMLVRYSREMGLPRPRIDLAAWRGMLVAAAPMAVSLFAWAIFSHLDIIMLGFMSDPAHVGWYAASYKVLVLGATGGQIVMNSFIPQLAAVYGDRRRMRERMRDYATTMMVIGMLVAAGGVALAPAILVLLFGEAYAPAVNAMRLLMGSLALIYLNMVVGNPLLVWHRQTGYMTAILAGGAINALANLYAIPRWGMEGAAAASLVSELVATVALAWLHARAVNQHYLGTLVKASLCAILAVVVATMAQRLLMPPGFLEEHPLVVLFAGGALITAVYALALPLTGLVRLSRLRRLVGATA